MPSRPAWLAAVVGLGGLVAYRAVAWRRRLGGQPSQPPPREQEVDSRAGELRRKLEEARPIVEERDAFEGAETTVDQADLASPPPTAAPEGEIDERRRAVHEEARATVDAMRTPPPEEQAGPIHDA